MKRITIIITAIVVCIGILFALGGCFNPAKMKVGLVDKDKLLANWGKYRALWSEYQVERELLARSIPSDPAKWTRNQINTIEGMNKKWQDKSKELEAEIYKVVSVMAKNKKLQIIVYKAPVEYGGIDITDELRKKLE